MDIEEEKNLLETKPRNFEDVIVSAIGEFGKSQLIIVLACKLPMFIGAWSMIMMSFAGTEPDWWLQTKTNSSNETMSTVKGLFKKCPTNSNQTVVFDTKIHTIVNEWGLICSKDWIPNTMSTTQMVGVLIGAAVSGQVAQFIGRKKTLIFVYGLNLLVIFVEGFSTSWQMMIVCIFILGFSLGGMLVVIWCFLLEYVGTRYRTISGLIPFWGTGVMTFGLLFKVLPNWRHVCITIGLTGIPSFVLLFFIPESSRWLFTTGRYEDGKNILKDLAKRNGRETPDLSTLDEVLEMELKTKKKEKTHTYLSLIKIKSVRWKVAIFSFMWFFAPFGYYALTLGVGQLVGDTAVNMLLMGFGEMFSSLLVWMLARCLGRKYSTMVLWGATCISSFAITIAFYATVDSKFKIYLNVFALMSRLFLSAAWSSLVLFTIETFPTVIRTVAYGFVSVVGRIGGIAGTQNNSLSKISVHLPFTVNGVFALGCVLVCVFLADTYSAPMEDYVEEEKQNTEEMAPLKT